MKNNTNSKEQETVFTFSRKKFITAAVAGLTATGLSAGPLHSLIKPEKKIRAIAFDGFPIFDPRPVFALVNSLYPEKGAALSNTWRTKQFEYSWLRTAAGQYRDFWQVTEDALVCAARETGVTLSDANRKQLMEQYLVLNTWPDVLPVLQTLRQNGLRLCFLSNLTNQMLHSSAKHAGIENYFEHIISTDVAKTYKPSPAAYQLGIDELKLAKEEILFVASAGWDATGAAWFGYPNFWVNRTGAVSEELTVSPDGIGKTLTELLSFIK